MNDKIINYLEANQKITIEIDAKRQASTSIEFWEQLKEKIGKDYRKSLITPIIYYSGNNSSNLVFHMYWVQNNHYLSFKISSDSSKKVDIYYIENSKDTEMSANEYEYIVGTPFPEYLINILLLFTE